MLYHKLAAPKGPAEPQQGCHPYHELCRELRDAKTMCRAMSWCYISGRRAQRCIDWFRFHGTFAGSLHLSARAQRHKSTNFPDKHLNRLLHLVLFQHDQL
ncbi:hypothetical protein NX059_009959 [Plenodomus lindquistii]|nr:hypothetical protein NX059_009959 [Plenodomus lindquistii]